MPYNPIILFKAQGTEQSDDINNLAKEDFLLVIQTEYQKDAMKHYGNKAILMDATHGTTQYDFLLISILVIDGYGEGQPVAWAISNREDATLLVQFLKAVHTKVGDIQPAYFMSDCAEQSFLNNQYEEFYKYYVPKVKEWATCYRVGTIVNTNMFVESFHRLLKVVYMNNKQNRRVDHLVHILL